MSAASTYKTYLMKKGTGDTYEKLVDIKDYPDLGGEPEMLETTTLSDNMQTYVAGIQSLEGLTFSCNYDQADFKKLKALEGQTGSYAIWFGATETGDAITPSGSEGKFEFDGQLSVFVTGGGVNEVRGMTVSIAPSTTIKFVEGTTA